MMPVSIGVYTLAQKQKADVIPGLIGRYAMLGNLAIDFA